jgi:hypothetical protein
MFNTLLKFLIKNNRDLDTGKGGDNLISLTQLQKQRERERKERERERKREKKKERERVRKIQTIS